MQSPNQKAINKARRTATQQLRKNHADEWMQLLNVEYANNGVTRRTKKEKAE